MKRNGFSIWAGLALALSFGCSGGGGDIDATPTDLVEHDSTADAGEDGTSEADTGADHGSPDLAREDLGPVDPLGFQIRRPRVGYEVTCSGGGSSVYDDADHVCTFKYDDLDGYVYFQASATDCIQLMSIVGIYSVPGAWMSVGGVVTPLEQPEYDSGGNHHNDFLEFDMNGKRMKVFHSTFNVGWHACQPMDCLQVFEGGRLTEDGCAAKERLLPVVCQPVQPDGTYGELLDNFEPCPNDPNW
jgi:hypothetical protein